MFIDALSLYAYPVPVCQTLITGNNGFYGLIFILFYLGSEMIKFERQIHMDRPHKDNQSG